MLGENSQFWVRTTFHGKEAHGSTPEEGINSIVLQYKFLLELVERMTTLKSSLIMGTPTLNIGKIQGGRQPNIVPENCFAELDFRLLSEQQKAQVEEIIKEIGESKSRKEEFSMEILSDKRPLVSNYDDPFVKTFLEVAKRVTKMSQQTKAAPFCTDLPTLFPERVVPFVVFGPGSIKQAHQPDEFIEKESLSNSSAILREFLLKVLYQVHYSFRLIYFRGNCIIVERLPIQIKFSQKIYNKCKLGNERIGALKIEHIPFNPRMFKLENSPAF